MRLHIISPALPPQLDGIGDYTAQIAGELSAKHEVTILTDRDSSPATIPGVAIEPCFSPTQPASVRALLSCAREQTPDWVLLEYNPFAYGRWGLNLHLPVVMHAMRRQLPRTRIAIMFHEVFTPVINVKFAVMTTWQRAQFLALGRSADCIFFSIEAWAHRFRRWFPSKPLTHLPVGSNIPRVEMQRGEARRRLGIAPETVVLGVFGTAHPSRMLELTRHTARALLDAAYDCVVLYIGPDTSAVERELYGTPLIATAGAVSPAEVSKRFAAMDVHLVPFVDGISTRRGTVMTGLQHGVATVGTRGRLTDSILLEADGQALLLAPVEEPEMFRAHVLRAIADADLRNELGARAQELYEREFDWPCVAERFLHGLERNEQPSGAPTAHRGAR